MPAPPPRYGADSRAILGEFALVEGEIEELIASGIFLEQRRH